MKEFKTNKFSGNNAKYKGKYLNRFMSMRASVDMMTRNLFPNAKEITESFGIFDAVKYLPIDWKTPCNFVVVGDGCTPRTAATAAFQTVWECYSIDPLLKIGDYNIRRLHMIKNKVEEVDLTLQSETIIVMPHSHASVENALQHITAPIRHLITMECCRSLHYKNKQPIAHYNDDQIWSPKNLIKVWENI